jgi:hypothetical protein
LSGFKPCCPSCGKLPLLAGIVSILSILGIGVAIGVALIALT